MPARQPNQTLNCTAGENKVRQELILEGCFRRSIDQIAIREDSAMTPILARLREQARTDVSGQGFLAGKLDKLWEDRF
jgi:hypothetical protein